MGPTLTEVARDPFAYIGGPLVELDRRRELVLRNEEGAPPLAALALRPRLARVDAALEHARAWFAARGRDSYVWWVSDAAQPPDLLEHLLAAGAVPEEDDPVCPGMVLDRAPDAVVDIEARRLTTLAEHCAVAEMAWRAAGLAEDERAALRPRLQERYAALRRDAGSDSFVALVDGEVVGGARAAYLPCGVYLAGAVVAPEARGRGVYRALVRARWDEAVRRGIPALVVHPGRMSRPIVARLGFETVCTVHTLVDRTGISKTDRERLPRRRLRSDDPPALLAQPSLRYVGRPTGQATPVPPRPQ